MFQQQLDDQGAQIEMPDDWLIAGNVWEIARPEVGASGLAVVSQLSLALRCSSLSTSTFMARAARSRLSVIELTAVSCRPSGCA